MTGERATGWWNQLKPWEQDEAEDWWNHRHEPFPLSAGTKQAEAGLVSPGSGVEDEMTDEVRDFLRARFASH